VSRAANAEAFAAPIATANAAALLQQTGQLHIQSTLSDAYGEAESGKRLDLEQTSLPLPSSIARPVLRPYQVRAIEKLHAAIAAGVRALLLVLSTGAGKTIIAAELIRMAVEQRQRVLFLAPRRELVQQTSAKLAGQRHGLLLAGSEGRIDLYAPVQVASVDTLRSRVRRKRLVLPNFDMVIVDEAHLHVTEARKALLELWPQALRIGLTATPTRRDGRALGLLFDRLIEPTTTAELTRTGYLAPARYFSVSKPDLSRVRTVAGDYNAKDLEGVMMDRPALLGDIVRHWLTHAPTRRTVLFATSIKHSVALAEEFLQAGVAAEHVDANTPAQMREATFARFRAGQTQMLCNCFLASYGFDLPELNCVILARPTRSLMLYLQMIGRGLRAAEGKSDCLILDHSGAVHQHGFATDAREWTLEGNLALVRPDGPAAKERPEAKMLTCPECACCFTGTRLCPECGYFFAPKGKEIRTMAGELVEIGEHLERHDQDRLAFYAELRGIARERRFKDGWAAHKYREKHGDWPPRSFGNTPIAMPSNTTRRWVQCQYIAWRKQKQGAPA
jgi:DNA repair protein RadD